MSLFLARLNRTLTVKAKTKTGSDGGGQPIYSLTTKGTIRGRIDPKVAEEVRNDSDLNAQIATFLGITELPSGFAVAERDTVTDDTGSYEVLGVSSLDGAVSAHHLELSLRRVSA